MTTRQKRKEQSLREKLLSHDCLRSVLNKETLEKLPKDVQDELFKLLPETDRLAIEQGDSQSVLNNFKILQKKSSCLCNIFQFL